MTFEELLRQLAAPARRALAANSVTNIETLARYSEREIAGWHGIGRRAMEPIRAAIQSSGGDLIDSILQRVALALHIRGVCGIVLGGSRARGTHVQGSDIDIGIYYDETLDDAQLQAAARMLDDQHRDRLISPPGGWGPWVNAGGWLVIEGTHVDLILRDIGRVSGVVRDCVSGDVSAHYQPGHPHAFINAMYLGELAVCRVLFDPNGQIAELKSNAFPYPPNMKRAILHLFRFEAGFSLELAEKYTDAQDLYYVTAHAVRCVSAVNQVLFALNEQYFLNEKRAVAAIDHFPLSPADYQSRVDRAMALLGSDAKKACGELRSLCEDTWRIADSQ